MPNPPAGGLPPPGIILAHGILLKRQGWYTVVGHLSQMRRIFLTAALGVALLLPAQLGAQADAPVLKLIRDYIEALRVQAGIPGLAVAVVGANSIVYEQAFGRQDVERSIAARPDTPFHVDGLTQLFTASYLLRCVEEGRLSLDDRIGDYKSDVPEPNATIRQLLTHTSGPAASPTFHYGPERLDPLTAVVRACAVESFRGSTMDTLDRLAMRDSVPAWMRPGSRRRLKAFPRRPRRQGTRGSSSGSRCHTASINGSGQRRRGIRRRR